MEDVYKRQGLAAVLILMVVAYRGLGLIADLALMFYVIIVLNVMAAMGSVLTLPGIAGIILSVGMAVDANVVIFSRIREEIENGKTVRSAVQAGFKRALSTVIAVSYTHLRLKRMDWSRISSPAIRMSCNWPLIRPGS